MKAREPRTEVRIGVRFVAEAGWADAEVRNISDGGLMAVSAAAPCQGSYVEIRREGYSIVGRVIWSSGTRFGLQARERINLAELSRPRPNRTSTGERRADPDDRRQTLIRRPSNDERAQASFRQARAINFIALGLAVAGFAYAVAHYSGQTLAAPLHAASEAMRAATAD